MKAGQLDSRASYDLYFFMAGRRKNEGKNAMKIKIFQVDAFTDALFHGNPAAVCPLEAWLPAEKMQLIAMENNLSETAFYVKGKERYEIRWFTPAVEVDLCGHATLATAYVIFNLDGYQGRLIEFDSRSGLLTVKKEGDFLTLNFPADRVAKADVPEGLLRALGAQSLEAYKGRTDYLLVFGSQKDIEEMKPDFGLLGKVPARGIIVTAKGSDVDFVSRFFAPRVGVAEDPVTGSAHTLLTPFWAGKLGKQELTARQLSRRRGWLKCRLAGDRVEISGQARAYLSGQIEVE
jgi:PhzF family phenazine biosynthesis protein